MSLIVTENFPPSQLSLPSGLIAKTISSPALTSKVSLKLTVWSAAKLPIVPSHFFSTPFTKILTQVPSAFASELFANLTYSPFT